MISDRPSWLRHEGLQIFCIDVEPAGLRFATGGGDHKVRIWNTKCVGRKLPKEGSVDQLLATLRDHYGPVNCVRWAKHGRLIASGSDDQVILIHERKPGSGTTEFGSGEPPDVENWKVYLTLRGHTADVVDLNWSPDDSALASASLDNTIHIWNMSNGICTAVLRGHDSLVKGVTWDPIGSFVASQSDDKTVIIWRTSDWSLAHRTDGHWSKSLGSTFFRRLGWSPCGHLVTTTHGYQKPRHSAPVLERGEWSATFDFLGHNAPIIVVRFNHSLFRRSTSKSHHLKASSVGWTKGSSKTGGIESQPYNILAIGSQDRTISVWKTARPRPVFVAMHYFSQSVVDLSWSPDGYSLFACSLDGTVTIFHFKAAELGHKLTDTELDELKRNRYGDVRRPHAHLAESPAQLCLEEASATLNKGKRTTADGLRSDMSLQVSGNAIIGTDSLQSETILGMKRVRSIAEASNKANLCPVKQKVYRQANGKKRIIPEAVGMSSQQENVSGGASQSLGFYSNLSEHNNIGNNSNNNNENSNVNVDGFVEGPTLRRPVGGSFNSERTGVTARAAISDSLIVEKVPVSAATDGSMGVEQVGILRNPSSATGGNILIIRVLDKKEGEDMLPVSLEARPKQHAANDNVVAGNTFKIRETDVTCKRGTQTLWSDRISSGVTVLTGNTNFWAVGCDDGCLQVYTKCGRHAMPAMMMGSAPVFVDCDESWKLLLVTRKGSLYMWDLFNRKCLLHDSLASLVTSDLNSSGRDAAMIKVISAKLSKSGFPLVVLATRHAFLFDMSLMCWLRVADDSFPASNFASCWNSGLVNSGELADMQVDIGKFLARKPGWSRMTDDGVQTRAHLETQLASALALQSPNEYRQCLLSYIRFLSREADEARLREVCESFFGPPPGMFESISSDTNNSAWDPCVLGMRKHKLLEEVILPSMASNRKVQRLLNEFVDLLSEYENDDTH